MSHTWQLGFSLHFSCVRGRAGLGMDGVHAPVCTRYWKQRILRHLLGQRPGAALEGGRESARLGSHSGVCLGFSPLGRRGCGEGSVRSRTALGA